MHRTVDAAGVDEFSHFRALTKVAERGTLDSIFLADIPGTPPNVAFSGPMTHEPLTHLSAVAAVTQHIGLIGTATTSYYEPYNLARLFASLDLLSSGRAGWNMVTTGLPMVARNFGDDPLPAHEARYERADEFVEVVRSLWQSWDDGAVELDEVTGRYLDPERLRDIHHRGERFSVAGSLNVRPSPQGEPVRVQAGGSDRGLDFAARHSEVVFTSQHDIRAAVAFAHDLRARARALGRDPSSLLVLPGLSAIIGSSESEARAHAAELDDLVRPAASLALLSIQLGGFDVTQLDPDGPFPDLRHDPVATASRQRFRLITEKAWRENLTVAEVARWAARGHGHRVVVGTPEQVADDIVTWFDAGAADGFNLQPPVLPDGLTRFVDHVIPLLRSRGVFRREYESTTLRGHLGLPRERSTTRSSGRGDVK
ncbi:LLM class flavin-dependent oxidoreductase [Aeromicrobium alkaliterrae]|uniref:LLM class flavin-dependent oxidoreductase n=2 Tax=Aeromicrobium alkaliterrae TaxID=302168 RepID=A0ABN2K8S8_9ACTN